MERITGKVQTYDWGMRTPDCQVAALGAANTGVPATEGTPYAELWFGTHPSGAATVTDGTPLKSWLGAAPQQRLGAAVASRFGGDLPFLLKVLSVAKALSIQAHPDKELAQALHTERPDVYKDGNHKPEMALALTPFEAMVGFVTPKQLADAFAAVPELRQAVGDAHADAVIAAAASNAAAAQSALRDAFRALMTLSPAEVATHVTALKQRLDAATNTTPHDALALRLEQQYGADVGVLACFFLNYIVLAPGQAVALAANEPHAYVAGQCVECMATSDNVVRAGLTPKLRDVETLCSMLTYSQQPPLIMSGAPQQSGGVVTTYAPGFDEFCVDCFTIHAGGEMVAVLPPSPGPSVVLITDGSAILAATQEQTAQERQLDVASGTAVFVLPGHALRVRPAPEKGAVSGVRARVSDSVFA